MTKRIITDGEYVETENWNFFFIDWEFKKYSETWHKYSE